MKAKLLITTMLAAIAVLSVAVWHRSSKQNLVTTVHPASLSKSAPKTDPIFTARALVNAPSQEQLSAAVKTILDEKVRSDLRQKAADELKGNLSGSNREALYDFLRQHMPQDDGQIGQVLKNELLNALCQMQPPPDGLRELLTDIYRNGSQNIVLRDYAVQHLAAFYRQMTVAPGMDSLVRDNELKQTQDVLWGALGETDTSIAGTALLGMTQLSQQGWLGFDRQKISDAALKLANDDTACELTRITAFQVCTSLNVQDALPVILGAAQAPQTKPVQISAIAALGQLGGPAQEPLLNSFIQGNDMRLKLPAQHALNQIQWRNQQSHL